ncbi:Spermidine/spermine N(1)-acetyltransferase [Arenibacter antarcticus]|uniref:GNAT family N-acetyltransferase n=1 Tax=Arenibacter antarcticus TaxID=2040469 RepID=A0ABW5V9B9_9FLAO|nr:GNAT family N-acetyltransferase [Arenibacter sp. H213]MCM4167918.1 GNAT family N-acetyltransferase [Arenibacter sp. H213]
MELHVTLCSKKDLDTLVQLGKRTFIEAFKEKNNPDDFNEYLETAFNREVYSRELEERLTSYFFIYKSAVIVGYFKVNQGESQTDIKDDNAMELERIYVLRKFQGLGIGKWILNQVMEMARAKNKRYLWLGVWEYNGKAIEFYLRHGFVKFGTHPYYIGKDKQTDWLMKCEL